MADRQGYGFNGALDRYDRLFRLTRLIMDKAGVRGFRKKLKYLAELHPHISSLPRGARYWSTTTSSLVVCFKRESLPQLYRELKDFSADDGYDKQWAQCPLQTKIVFETMEAIQQYSVRIVSPFITPWTYPDVFRWPIEGNVSPRYREWLTDKIDPIVGALTSQALPLPDIALETRDDITDISEVQLAKQLEQLQIELFSNDGVEVR